MIMMTVTTDIVRTHLWATLLHCQGVVGISDIIVKPGLINVDFADVRCVQARETARLMALKVGPRCASVVKCGISSACI